MLLSSLTFDVLELVDRHTSPDSLSPESIKLCLFILFFFSSRRRHTRLQGDWSSDVCSSDLHFNRDRLRISESRFLDNFGVELYPFKFLCEASFRRKCSMVSAQ